MAMTGNALIRRELCDESIRLARLLAVLLNQESLHSEVPEALGLLALVLLHDSRREARVGGWRAQYCSKTRIVHFGAQQNRVKDLAPWMALSRWTTRALPGTSGN